MSTEFLVYSPGTSRLVPLISTGMGGGQSDIFAHRDDPSLLAAVPKPDEDPVAYWEKLDALLAIKNLSVDAAWPLEILVDPADKRTPRAWTMKKKSGVPLSVLVVPAEREALGIGHWGMAEMRDVAVFFSKIFARFERLGIVLADNNPDNFHVSWNSVTKTPKGVSRLDVLSFCFHRNNRYYTCDVAVHEFLPPEMQGVDLGRAVWSKNADRFGLAAIIFTLLTGGYPWSFSGGGAQTPDEKVKNKQFALFSNPPGTKVPDAVRDAFYSLPVEAMVLFERAFLGAEDQRPSPQDWVRGLRLIAKPPAVWASLPKWLLPGRSLFAPVVATVRGMSPARRWSVLCVLFLILAWLALPKGKEAPQPGATGSEAAIRTYPAVLTSGVPTHPKPTSSAPEARPAPDQPAVTASDEEPALPTGRKPANPNGWQGINRPTSKR